MRIKDGNEDEPESEIGENFEILLQFVLDCRQLPAAEVIEKYFVEDSTLSLSNNALRKELKSGSKDPEKLKAAEDDVKNVSAIKRKCTLCSRCLCTPNFWLEFFSNLFFYFDYLR